VTHWIQNEPYPLARIALAPEEIRPGLETNALMRSLVDVARELLQLMSPSANETADFLAEIEDPRQLLYLVASNARMDIAASLEFLMIDDLHAKYHFLLTHLAREKEILELGLKIRSDTKEKLDKAHREYFLRQQMKAIQEELGESETDAGEIDVYTRKISASAMPAEARTEALRELKRFRGMAAHAAEYGVIRTYLDWLIELPWGVRTEDRRDIRQARQILDEDHHDLNDVKERILEYLAVQQLLSSRSAPIATGVDLLPSAIGMILCFVGPPGVGKTSLWQSIARALDRRFTRLSLGGMQDEAEIRGHRRTYVGALPGRIIQALKRAGSCNPVFMLDEIGKVGTSWRGDPSSALLEVLDPAQNHAFRDHYLDLDFDLSEVMFITTANQVEPIPPPLRDRLEILNLEGYTEYEKLEIARNFLVPRQIVKNGLQPGEITFSSEALCTLIRNYTREAGVRDLERRIGTLCRKVAFRIAAEEITAAEIDHTAVHVYLKKELFEAEASEIIELPGIAIGLAVTAAGGDILFIETTRTTGSGELTLTGQLGDVMRESARIASSYVHSKAKALKIDSRSFKQYDVHVHVPAGAIPKDGPSAGLPLAVALASLFSGRKARRDIGLTGEITLRGRVLPVGGIRMKAMAAPRAGLTMVILPRKNAPDLEDLPEEIGQAMEFRLIDRIDEAFDIVLADQTTLRRPRQTCNPPKVKGPNQCSIRKPAAARSSSSTITTRC
jgi:ATP-dependent Lon protease